MEGSENLCAMLDDQFEKWYQDTLRLERVRDPARCPAELLDELGYILSADIVQGDAERVKRVKIASAIDHGKSRGTWPRVKDLIDAWTGTDCRIFHAEDSDDWVLIGNTISGGDYWSILGGYPDERYGIRLFSGTGADGMMLIGGKGYIYIDLNSSEIPEYIIQGIRNTLIAMVPAYFRVFLGYIDENDFIGYGEV
jgi:phage tail-like protein